MLAACAPPAIEDYVYRRAAHEVYSVRDYLGRIFSEQSDIAGIRERVSHDDESAGRAARPWDPSRPDTSWGGNWIIAFQEGEAATDVSADVVITIPGGRSGGFLSSKSADVLICVRYLGTTGSDDVSVVDTDCPEETEAKLPSFQRVTVDQLAEYEDDE